MTVISASAGLSVLCFAACVLTAVLRATLHFAGSLATAGLVTLKALVITGAVLQVVARGAKFSLFKPAEEMVYIGLDDESRTKGRHRTGWDYQKMPAGWPAGQWEG